MKTVTAAIIGDGGGRILIARRLPEDKNAGMWEFPGGKMEPGETPEICLARELMEEFGVASTIGEFFGESIYHYGHGSIRLIAYHATIAAAPRPLAHAELLWVTPAEMAAYEFSPADIPFVQRLRQGAG